MNKLFKFALIDIIISVLSIITSLFIYNFTGIDFPVKRDELKNENYQILFLSGVLSYSFILLIFRKFKKLNFLLNIKYLLLIFPIYIIMMKFCLYIFIDSTKIETIYYIYFFVLIILTIFCHSIAYVIHRYLKEKYIDFLYLSNKEIFLEIKQYLWINPSSYFSIGFMFLLIVSMFLVLLDKNKIAELSATIAYTMLFMAIIIEINKIKKT